MKDTMDEMMKHAKNVQEKMKKVQEDLAKLKVKGESGAGMITVTMTGRYDVVKVNIDPSLLSDDVGILEDLVAAAFNDAVRKVEASNNEKVSGLTAGFNLPNNF